jgi:hypothetical protein
MKASPVLEALARLYEKSQAGRTGRGRLDFQPTLKRLLEEAGCTEGDARDLAERELRALNGPLLQLEYANPRDQSDIFKVRLSPGREADFFAHIGRRSPGGNRNDLASLFRAAAEDTNTPEQWRESWRSYCETIARAAEQGDSVQPFSRTDFAANAELLELLPRLLAWQGESLIRFVSCRLCRNSKRLESLAALDTEGKFVGKHRGKVGQLLETITNGEIRTLDDLGILANPRSALIHGSLRLVLNGATLDFGVLQGSFRLSRTDIERAEEVSTTAFRCITIENEASFHELAKLQSGALLVHTSYPGSATVGLLKKLRGASEFWHFGDSDNAGFEILRVLSQKSGRQFQALHMMHGRVPFEQEALGPPKPDWPFYD